MKEREEALIKRMQDNLSVIRKVGGWTTSQFGEEIGVTRQTISNLEKGKSPLTKTQYLAIRAVLIHEIGANDNEGLAQVVRTLVDKPLEEPGDETPGGELKPTKNAMEDMSKITELLASESAHTLLAAASKALSLTAMHAVPAVVHALTKYTTDKQA